MSAAARQLTSRQADDNQDFALRGNYHSLEASLTARRPRPMSAALPVTVEGSARWWQQYTRGLDGLAMCTMQLLPSVCRRIWYQGQAYARL